MASVLRNVVLRNSIFQTEYGPAQVTAFTATGTLAIPASICSYLVVAGGGGGSSGRAAGGGGGGVGAAPRVAGLGGPGTPGVSGGNGTTSPGFAGSGVINTGGGGGSSRRRRCWGLRYRSYTIKLLIKNGGFL